MTQREEIKNIRKLLKSKPNEISVLAKAKSKKKKILRRPKR